MDKSAVISYRILDCTENTSSDASLYNGKFKGPIAPYGYKKSSLDKYMLIIDEETASTVRLIFDLFISGEDFCSISEKLNNAGIKTPSEEKKLHCNSFRSEWNEAIVKRILTNKTYIGCLTQKHRINSSQPHIERIVVDNAHEPIISRDVFEDVQRILCGRSYPRNKGQLHLLTGLLFCGDCNAPMTVTRENPQRCYLLCSAWKKNSRARSCTSHSIREDIVINAVLTQLYTVAKSVDTDELTFLFKENNNNKLIISLENKISEDKNTLLCLYKDKCRGIVSEEDYISMAEELKKEMLFYKSQLECFTELQNEMQSYREVKKYISDILNFEKINKAFLCLLVKRILIFSDKRIVIEFNFKEPK